MGSSFHVEDLAEVLWAPDSGAFAITQSDGEWVGGWSVSVYKVGATGVRPLQAATEAFADFSRRKVTRRAFGCSVESPNIGAIEWKSGSERLVLIAEAPPHSSCCDMGRLGGYLVEVETGVIVARYNQADLATLFRKRLGTRFR